MTEPPEGTIAYSTSCVFCGKEHITHLDKVKLQRWRAGERIQLVFPEMSSDDREILISGTCPQCWSDHLEAEE